MGWLAACAGSPAPAVAPRPEHRPEPAPRPDLPVMPHRIHVGEVGGLAAGQDRAGGGDGPSGGGAAGPDVLLPADPAADTVVATVGELEVRASHAYQRLFDTDPARARQIVSTLVLDIMVARCVEEFGIVVDEARVEVFVDEEIASLRRQVEAVHGGDMPFARYLLEQFGMREAEHRRWLRLHLTRKFYREYAIRYAGLREDRVEVRYIVSGSRETLEQVRQRVLAGADFATLAMRYSEDENRREGGLLPPFGRSFRHPVTGAAFELEPGQMSEILRDERGGQTRYYLVWCRRRMPGRDVSFAEVRDEIDRLVERQPLSDFEIQAFEMQIRGDAGLLPSGDGR